jgi:O-antigen/teichoic acid export membrane protein
VTVEEKIEEKEALGLTDQVRGAVLWRTGSQLVAQLVTWASTFLVIRLLEPSDYGLFAMSQAILMLLTLMNGWGYANALVRLDRVTRLQIRQVFGMLLLTNGALAVAQIAMAPLAARYFHQPPVADLLRVQALLFLATPFIALPQALLARRMEFRGPAKIHLLAATLSAGTALACAWSGVGVWTLVAAPLVLFGTQAVGLTWLARSLVAPSFRFAGAGPLFRYGSAMILVQFFWFVQSQSDILIAGRTFSPHALGLYTTALFLTQILAAKFVPPLNDVAFAAYSRLQDRPGAVAEAFLKSVRLILLIALPFYLGLAATAEPLVLTVLGPKWAEAVPLVRLFAFGMPFMTLQILFQPATNALGRPRIALKVAMTGAVLMPACFLVGVRFGAVGMALAWLAAFPLLLAATAALSLPAIGASAAGVVRAAAPGLCAAAAMAAAVTGLDALLPAMAAPARLAILVPFGAAVYAGLLFAFARPLVEDVLRLALRRPAVQAL